MKSQLCVPVGTGRLLKLAEFLRQQGSDRDIVDVVDEAIEQMLILMENDPETFLHHRFPDTESRGYVWKNKETHLFLPHGTQIRMRYRDQYHYAKVEGDEIIYEGRPVSPSALANTITNSSRNAWRDLWIKKPGQADWLLADNCRTLKDKIDDGKEVES